MKVFRKNKMLQRIKEENLEEFLGPAEMAIMDKLDGQEALPNLWRQTVHGESDAYYCVVDGEQIPVNLVDCEEV